MAENDDLRAVALECYRAAVRDVAFYAIELDPDTTSAYRHELARLEAQADMAQAEALPLLLREYRDQTLTYVNRLSRELAETAATLRQILDSFAEGDGEYDVRMRRALARLQELARSPESGPVHDALTGAITAVKSGLDEISRRQEGTISRLMEEIHSLHKKIDSMESAASVEGLAAVLTRAEIEKLIRSAAEDSGHAVLLAVTGLREAQEHFDKQVATQLAAAFLKRLHRILPARSVVGRWSEEEFLVLIPAAQRSSAPAEKTLQDQLSGSYACSQDGKSVRPTLQVRVTTPGAECAA